MSPTPLTIAVANRKGGTGKTTTAVNLAAEWGQCSKNTLLIDLDTQGHAAIGLGFAAGEQTGVGIHDILYDEARPLADAVYPTPTPGVWVCPANTRMETRPLPPQVLRERLQTPEIAERFTRILIDTPPTNDAILVNALTAADGVLVPFVPHHLAGIGVKQLARLFYQIATRHNPDLRLFGLLPVMYDRNIRLHRQVLADLRKQFGQKRLLRGIRSNIRLAEAFAHSVPVRRHAPKSAGSMDYHLLAEELETLLDS